MMPKKKAVTSPSSAAAVLEFRRAGQKDSYLINRDLKIFFWIEPFSYEQGRISVGDFEFC